MFISHLNIYEYNKYIFVIHIWSATYIFHSTYNFFIHRGSSYIPFTSHINYWPKEHSFVIESSRKLAMFSDVWDLFTLITLCELPKNKAWNSPGAFRKCDLSLIDIIKFLETQKNKENLFEGYIPHQRFSVDYFFKLQRPWNRDQNGIWAPTALSHILHIPDF